MRITGAVLEEIGRERPYDRTRPLTVADVDLADPGPGEVRVAIEAAGLCHSDLSVIDGNRVRPVPMLLGHEAAGRVEALGEGVEDLQRGQRVVMTFLPRCGSCEGCATQGRRPCLAGSAANNAGTLLSGARRLTRDGEQIQHHLGVSGFATHAVVDTRSLVPVGDDVPAEVASLMGCAVLTGGGAVLHDCDLKPGQTLGVVGLGGVGMAAVLTGLATEGVEVLAVDPLPAKVESARALGAHRAMTPDEAAEQGVRADAVVEAAGSARAFETALALTGPGGRTVTVGLPHPDDRASVSPLQLVAEARTIVGSYLGSAVPSRDVPLLIDLWRQGQLPVERLVSGRIRLEAINAGMDALADGTTLRQIIEIG